MKTTAAVSLTKKSDGVYETTLCGVAVVIERTHKPARAGIQRMFTKTPQWVVTTVDGVLVSDGNGSRAEAIRAAGETLAIWAAK